MKYLESISKFLTSIIAGIIGALILLYINFYFFDFEKYLSSENVQIKFSLNCENYNGKITLDNGLRNPIKNSSSLLNIELYKKEPYLHLNPKTIKIFDENGFLVKEIEFSLNDYLNKKNVEKFITIQCGN